MGAVRGAGRLTDEQLAVVVEGAHGWSGRDLMAHMLAWQAVSLEAAKELAVNETSPTIARVDADWDARGGDVVNAEITRDLGGGADRRAAGAVPDPARRAARVPDGRARRPAGSSTPITSSRSTTRRSPTTRITRRTCGRSWRRRRS